MSLQIELISPAELRPNPRNARTHSRKQIQQIADSISAFGFNNPIVVDEANMEMAGHGRLEAARKLGLQQVPIVRLASMTEVQKRAYVLADNKIAENAGWDRGLLALELGELAVELPSLELGLEITGFEVGEIDAVLADRGKDRPHPDDELPEPTSSVVSCKGDLWQLGDHRLLCGDARSAEDLALLMAGSKADACFVDKPYNVSIKGLAGGRGAVRHEEFAMASGEMSRAEFAAFALETDLRIAEVLKDGGLVYSCIDWRSVDMFVETGRKVFDSLLNIIVWNKTNAGQGSFYRSQHEFILLFKVGSAPHCNAIDLGKHGRNRSNVWTYPGVNTFRKGRLDDLRAHPTVKPVALFADALRDCTLPHEIVLDLFLGSGTTLLAAEKVGRRCYGLEIEPRFVDVTIRRWQVNTRLEAVLASTGETFDEVARKRKTSAVVAERQQSDPADQSRHSLEVLCTQTVEGEPV